MRRIRLLIVALSIWIIFGLGFSPHAGVALEDQECAEIGSDGIEVCGVMLDHWQANDGEALFGSPLTPQFEEFDPEIAGLRVVQYFDRARLEYHPENEDTPYAVQSGRLGAEHLAAEDIDWETLPKADPDDPSTLEATGQVIAPEFQDFWESNGLDLGNEGVTFRESLALYGYPISPAEEIESSNGPVLIQWFERARLEVDESGVVRAAPIGAELNENSEGLSLRVQREIEHVVANIFETHDAPGLGVWASSPEVGAWEWVSGFADPEEQEPYSWETHHRIGSVTKSMIANVLLQLVDDGLLNLDDTVDQWFPDLERAEHVSIRMLGNMTSGIFNYTETLPVVTAIVSDPERVWEPEELLRFGFELTDSGEPEGTFAYSNTNYVMLGLIVEEVTGEGIADVLQERIFDSLDLDDTSFPRSEDVSLPEPYARGVSSIGLGSNAQDATDWNPSVAWAAGQVISTPADMLDWAVHLHDSDLLSDASQEQQRETVSMLLDDELSGTEEQSAPGYGLGVLEDAGWYAHDGMLSGYTSLVAYHPGLDLSLIAFANSDAISSEGTLPTGLAFQAIRQILDREYSVSD